MERKEINTVDWWSDEYKTEGGMPAGIVLDESASKADAMSMPVATPVTNAAPIDMAKYPVQSLGAQQVAPVIQPLVIVPYVSKDQPLRYLDKPIVMGEEAKEQNDDGVEYFEDVYGIKKASQSSKSDTQSAEKLKKVGYKKSSPNGGAIAGFVFGVLYILMLFNWSKIIGNFMASFKYNWLLENKAAYEKTYEVVERLIDGSFFGAFDVKADLADAFLIVGIVLTVFTILVALFSCASRTPKFFKWIAGIAFLFHVVAYLLPAVIFPLADKTDMVFMPEYYGIFVLSGLCLLVMICVLAARNKKSK